MRRDISDEHHPDVRLRFADKTQNDSRQSVTGRNRQRGRADAYGRSWTKPHCNCRRKLQYAEQRKHRAGSCSEDRKSTRLNSSHLGISYAVFCLKKKKPIGTPMPSIDGMTRLKI